MNLYRIRRSADGLFSEGGECPRWSREGKIWKWNALRLHLAWLGHWTIRRGGKWPYHECAIVKYRLEQVSHSPVLLP